MRFEFTFGSDSELAVRGTPVGNPQTEVFQRAGPYRFQDGQLISEAINQGQLVKARLDGSHLILKFGGELEFRLKRKESSQPGDGSPGEDRGIDWRSPDRIPEKMP
jgi:hypothetical protein